MLMLSRLDIITTWHWRNAPYLEPEEVREGREREATEYNLHISSRKKFCEDMYSFCFVGFVSLAVSLEQWCLSSSIYFICFFFRGFMKDAIQYSWEIMQLHKLGCLFGVLSDFLRHVVTHDFHSVARTGAHYTMWALSWSIEDHKYKADHYYRVQKRCLIAEAVGPHRTQPRRPTHGTCSKTKQCKVKQSKKATQRKAEQSKQCKVELIR